MLQRINDFLDQHVLPWPVRYLTFRFVILATIGAAHSIDFLCRQPDFCFAGQ